MSSYSEPPEEFDELQSSKSQTMSRTRMDERSSLKLKLSQSVRSTSASMDFGVRRLPPPRFPHLKRQTSARMHSQWAADYKSRVKRGDKEWQRDRNLQVFDVSTLDVAKGLSALSLEPDTCLLIVPRNRVPKDTGLVFSSDDAGDEESKKKEVDAYLLPVLQPTMGHPCIDIRQMFAKTKLTTYDPGFMSTSSCHSAITFIDGAGGRLLHRGYSIEELCAKVDFSSLVYLLLYGHFPENAADYSEHEWQLKSHALVHQKMIEFYRGFNYDAHPMAIMCAVVGALSSFYNDSTSLSKAEHRLVCAYRLIAKMPTLAAMAYKTSVGQPIMYPKNELSYASNFLYMMFAVPTQEYVVNPLLAAALDKFLMLHADHEQNASTSTVRIAGSSHANPYACIASGITALWGPAHGGANEAVLKMLQEIGSKENIPKFVARAKDKKDPFRLMGFGHRVYKNYDPRAKVMQKMCHELLADLGVANDPLLELAMELERVALSDAYFVERKLFPNVDYYSGIVLKAMGIPVSMYTVLFAVARTVGWVSQWKEMIEDPKQRIGRPRQLFVGQRQRPLPELSFLHTELLTDADLVSDSDSL